MIGLILGLIIYKHVSIQDVGNRDPAEDSVQHYPFCAQEVSSNMPCESEPGF